MEQYGMVRKAEEHRGDNENATEGNGSYEKRRWFTWSRDVTCDITPLLASSAPDVWAYGPARLVITRVVGRYSAYLSEGALLMGGAAVILVMPPPLA
jgi:hypothetical protein